MQSEIGVGRPVVTSVVFGSGTSFITGTVTYATTRSVTMIKDGASYGIDVAPGYGTWGTTEPKEIVTPDHHPGNTGSFDEGYITLDHPGRQTSTDAYDATDESDAIIMTITFSTEVTNLSLTVTGVDAELFQWIDKVTVSPADVAFVFAQPAALTGKGTLTEPFEAVNQTGGIGREDDAGDVRLTWPGAFSVFTVLYRAADEDNLSLTGQQIRVGDFLLSC